MFMFIGVIKYSYMYVSVCIYKVIKKILHYTNLPSFQIKSLNLQIGSPRSSRLPFRMTISAL
jgi:hypothetical protein